MSLNHATYLDSITMQLTIQYNHESDEGQYYFEIAPKYDLKFFDSGIVLPPFF